MRTSLRLAIALIAAAIAAILVATCTGGKRKPGGETVPPPAVPPSPASAPATVATAETRNGRPAQPHPQPHPLSPRPAPPVPPPRPAAPRPAPPPAAVPAPPPVPPPPPAAEQPDMLARLLDSILATAEQAGLASAHVPHPPYAWDASPDAASGPQAPRRYEGKLYMLDTANNRIAVFSLAPGAGAPLLAVVLGQADKTHSSIGCDAATLNGPESVSVADGRIVVADGANNRVLIWNTLPGKDGASADLVLGQPDMDSCGANSGGKPGAATLAHASGAWTDGSRVVVLDRGNNRVLIWNGFPTQNGQPADIVLGQPDFESRAQGSGMGALSAPEAGVFVNARGQLFVHDAGNRRILVWRSFPAANRQPADVALKDAEFAADVAASYADEFCFLYPANVTAVPPQGKGTENGIELEY